jgi:hypothetical protein
MTTTAPPPPPPPQMNTSGTSVSVNTTVLVQSYPHYLKVIICFVEYSYPKYFK